MKQNKNNRFAALLLALCMAVCCAPVSYTHLTLPTT